MTPEFQRQVARRLGLQQSVQDDAQVETLSSAEMIPNF